MLVPRASGEVALVPQRLYTCELASRNRTRQRSRSAVMGHGGIPRRPKSNRRQQPNERFRDMTVQADMSGHLARSYGEDARDRFWTIFEKLRLELGYSDYLGALELNRLEAMHHPKLLRMANWLVDYPFHERLYPSALAVVKAAQLVGTTSILSDGDAVFQPRKVQQSGLWPVFGDNVLIYVHKELELEDVRRHFPARQIGRAHV